MLRADHVAIAVFDAAASYRFYRGVLELPLVDALSGDDWGGRPWLMMIFALSDGRQLALCALRGAACVPDGLPQDVRHVALSTAKPSDLARWRARLRRHGVAFHEEDHGLQRSLYFSDPNGVTLEITAPPSPRRRRHSPSAQAEVKRWITV